MHYLRLAHFNAKLIEDISDPRWYFDRRKASFTFYKLLYFVVLKHEISTYASKQCNFTGKSFIEA